MVYDMIKGICSQKTIDHGVMLNLMSISIWIFYTNGFTKAPYIQLTLLVIAMFLWPFLYVSLKSKFCAQV